MKEYILNVQISDNPHDYNEEQLPENFFNTIESKILEWFEQNYPDIEVVLTFGEKEFLNLEKCGYCAAEDEDGDMGLCLCLLEEKQQETLDCFENWFYAYLWNEWLPVFEDNRSW